MEGGSSISPLFSLNPEQVYFPCTSIQAMFWNSHHLPHSSKASSPNSVVDMSVPGKLSNTRVLTSTLERANLPPLCWLHTLGPSAGTGNCLNVKVWTLASCSLQGQRSSFFGTCVTQTVPPTSHLSFRANGRLLHLLITAFICEAAT